MGSFGYGLQGFANGLNKGLMGGADGKRLRYQKERNAIEDQRYLEEQKKKAIIDNLLQQKYRSEVEAAIYNQRVTNEDREGKESFLRNALKPEGYVDNWHPMSGTSLNGKSLGELGLMAGTLSANEQSKYLGGKGNFKLGVDPTILTTRARVDDNKAQRLFEKQKLTGKVQTGEALVGDIKEFWQYTAAIEGKGRTPNSYEEIAKMKEQTRPSPQMTETERHNKALRESVVNLSEQAAKDPNSFYENNNFRMNDDGTLYLDPVNKTPLRLKSFYTGTGKRGNIKAMMGLGEQWDDAKELTQLFALPEVKEALSQANKANLWDRGLGKFKNSIGQWMQGKGLTKNSPAGEAIARIQRMASEERKLYMGTAVTDNEIKSALAWMPSAGDSFDTMVGKTSLMGKEAEQAFRRWINIFEKDVDMSPFYKAFGIKRFGEGEPTKKTTELPVGTKLNWGQ